MSCLLMKSDKNQIVDISILCNDVIKYHLIFLFLSQPNITVGKYFKKISS